MTESVFLNGSKDTVVCNRFRAQVRGSDEERPVPTLRSDGKLVKAHVLLKLTRLERLEGRRIRAV